MTSRSRNLTDAEARWEAIVLIDAAVRFAIDSGAAVNYGEEHGWTGADQLAVEEHALGRVEGLIRRKGRAEHRAERRAHRRAS